MFLDFLSGFRFSFLLFDLFLASLYARYIAYTVIVSISILHMRELKSVLLKGWSINPEKGRSLELLSVQLSELFFSTGGWFASVVLNMRSLCILQND